jgi:hypothetical protein
LEISHITDAFSYGPPGENRPSRFSSSWPGETLTYQ